MRLELPGHEPIEVPRHLEGDAHRLAEGVAALAQVGVVEPSGTFPFDLFVVTALAFFMARALCNQKVLAGRLPANDLTAEREVSEWRAVAVRQAAHYGLLPETAGEMADAVTARAEERQLFRLFNLPEGWAPARIAQQQIITQRES